MSCFCILNNLEQGGLELNKGALNRTRPKLFNITKKTAYVLNQGPACSISCFVSIEQGGPELNKAQVVQ